MRNVDNGYWIAEADLHAADHAVAERHTRNAVRAILVMSDGVADGIMKYRIISDWAAAFSIARRSFYELIATVRNAEDAGSSRERWPRWKHSDDKAAAFIELTAEAVNP